MPFYYWLYELSFNLYQFPNFPSLVTIRRVGEREVAYRVKAWWGPFML